jgi:adenine-specific DNA methylase
LPELVHQLAIARFGHRPRVADTFCGGGSIPFEAARIGCDVYASDLNPIACMLTWGAFNIIGAPPEARSKIEVAQRHVAAAVDGEITRLGIEHDARGNRAKAYLYCLETHCPFCARNILLYQLLRTQISTMSRHERPALFTCFAKTLDWGNKLCYYGTGAARESISHLFANQAFNTFWN